MKYLIGVLCIILVIFIIWTLLVPGTFNKVQNRIADTFNKVSIINTKVDRMQLERDSLKKSTLYLQQKIQDRDKLIDSLSGELKTSQLKIDSISSEINKIDTKNYSDEEIKKFFQSWKK